MEALVPISSLVIYKTFIREDKIRVYPVMCE